MSILRTDENGATIVVLGLNEIMSLPRDEFPIWIESPQNS